MVRSQHASISLATVSESTMNKSIDSEKQSLPAKVVSLSIEGLFDEFNYSIESQPSLDGHENLMILYGNNGCGKTTILNLLVHVLSPEPYAGHRTAIGNAPFKKFAVFLSDGHCIEASRDSDKLTGEYTLTITRDGSTLVEYVWEREKKRPETEDEEEPAYIDYCKLLKNIGVTVHFLSDSRKVQSFKKERRRLVSRMSEVKSLYSVEFGGVRVDGDEEQTWVRDAMKNAVQSVRSLALAGTSRGYDSANSIYKDIIGRIVAAESHESEGQLAIKTKLHDRLQELGERNEEFASLGLTPSLDTHDFIDLINSANGDLLPTVDAVLNPYLDGVTARLDALQDAQQVISSFAELMTGFYHGKIVSFDIAEGITVNTTSNKELQPEDLSSGEQQLLLLMCNAITARKNCSVFAIDEPELSLNVKWQRKLIDALLKMLDGTNCQLLLATHSLEILSLYVDQVAELAMEQASDAEPA